MKKIAIVGASYLQEPLITKAKEMGLETHVFAWKCGDIGEEIADFFYPISIVEKEEILRKCVEIGIDGICTIASDLAVITVNYVAAELGLVGNSIESTELSTNKYKMRKAFMNNGNPSPKSFLVNKSDDAKKIEIEFPVIVKPTDRSGSRGITKVTQRKDLEHAIEQAINQSFNKKALIEEFVDGQEYSVEYVSYRGDHHFLALTHKFTTGAPGFVETAHLEPAPVNAATLDRVQEVIVNALNTLKIENGASHSEIKIDSHGNINIIEIGGRMGGDLIGSHLVYLSTGIDFVKAVIKIALGEKPDLIPKKEPSIAAVKYIIDEADLQEYHNIKQAYSDKIMYEDIKPTMDLSREITDSSARQGAYLVERNMNQEILNSLILGENLRVIELFKA